MIILLSICFVTSHPNPANHFVEYVQAYEERGVSCKVIAGKDVESKFAKIKSKVVVVDPSSLENEGFSSQLEKELASQNVVITDIATEQWITLHQMLNEKYPFIKRAVYYDNPERYVPGGYSQLAAKIIDKAQMVLFANSSLVLKGIEQDEGIPVDLSLKQKVGIGYYPKSDATIILELRQNKAKVDAIKSSLLESNAIVETGQRFFVYTGGANDEYYNRAFPHFIDLISKLVEANEPLLKNTILILQQHPRAKREGNPDAKLVEDFLSEYKLPEGFNFIVSDLPTNESLAVADGVFYYQTSMAAQFVFAEIPSVIQVGHDTYADLLVRAGFPSVTDAERLIQVLSSSGSGANVELLEKELGIDPDWKENLPEMRSLHNLEGQGK